MERARRTRSRIIVADTSTAGTSTTRRMASCRGSDAPGRANTTTSASAGSASTWYQAASSPAASAPSNNVKRFPGSRSANACSVRTVYDGAGSVSSMRSTARRRLPATARSSIAPRCSGLAPCAARLNGCSRAGRNRTRASSASPAASAAARCPTWTGSNEPPNRASTRGSGRRGGARVGRAGLVEPWSLGEETPQVRAGFLELVAVPDDMIALHQPHQGVRHAFGPRIVCDHVLEVDDARVEGAPLEVEHAVLVRLLRKPLLQLMRVQLRPGCGTGARIAPDELLVSRQRCLAVRRIELRILPQAHVGVARAKQRQRREIARRILIRDLSELVRRLHAVARLEVALGQVKPHIRHPRLGGPELVGETAERGERALVVAAAELGARLRQLGDWIRDGRDASVVTRRQEGKHDADDEQRTTHDPHGCFGGGVGDGASAFPSASIFCWARCAIVSPGAPPASACW